MDILSEGKGAEKRSCGKDYFVRKDALVINPVWFPQRKGA